MIDAKLQRAVEVLSTDPLPAALTYVPSTDQVKSSCLQKSVFQRPWCSCRQARSQVLKLGGWYKFLGGQDFCFYYMFKPNFSGHNKISGAQKIFGALFLNAPRGYGPGCNPICFNWVLSWKTIIRGYQPECISERLFSYKEWSWNGLLVWWFDWFCYAAKLLVKLINASAHYFLDSVRPCLIFQVGSIMTVPTIYSLFYTILQPCKAMISDVLLPRTTWWCTSAAYPVSEKSGSVAFELIRCLSTISVWKTFPGVVHQAVRKLMQGLKMPF